MRGAQDFLFFKMTQQNEGRLLCVGTWTKETQTPTRYFVVDLLLKSNRPEVKGDIFMLALCECHVFFLSYTHDIVYLYVCKQRKNVGWTCMGGF